MEQNLQELFYQRIEEKVKMFSEDMVKELIEDIFSEAVYFEHKSPIESLKDKIGINSQEENKIPDMGEIGLNIIQWEDATREDFERIHKELMEASKGLRESNCIVIDGKNYLTTAIDDALEKARLLKSLKDGNIITEETYEEIIKNLADSLEKEQVTEESTVDNSLNTLILSLQAWLKQTNANLILITPDRAEYLKDNHWVEV